MGEKQYTCLEQYLQQTVLRWIKVLHTEVSPHSSPQNRKYLNITKRNIKFIVSKERYEIFSRTTSRFGNMDSYMHIQVQVRWLEPINRNSFKVSTTIHSECFCSCSDDFEWSLVRSLQW